MTAPRVLIADDDLDFLEIVATAVHGLGADVIRAESGGDLIERMADEGPFDLVITDVSMPWMNGLQALQAARTSGIETPVIVVTALSDEDIPATLAKINGDAVLMRKPLELGELESMIERMLTPRSLRRT